MNLHKKIALLKHHYFIIIMLLNIQQLNLLRSSFLLCNEPRTTETMLNFEFEKTILMSNSFPYHSRGLIGGGRIIRIIMIDMNWNVWAFPRVRQRCM